MGAWSPSFEIWGGHGPPGPHGSYAYAYFTLETNEHDKVYFMWSQNEHTTYVSALLGNRADMALLLPIIFVVVYLGSGYSWQHYNLQVCTGKSPLHCIPQ